MISRLVENFEAIDVRHLGRRGLLAQGETHVVRYGQLVALEWTVCNRHGGMRPWFVCPRCHQRAACLYLVESLMCRRRRCGGLSYQSQHLDPVLRVALRRARVNAALHARLSANVGPRGGMYRRTRARLTEKLNAIDGIGRDALMAELDRLERGGVRTP